MNKITLFLIVLLISIGCKDNEEGQLIFASANSEKGLHLSSWRK